MTRWSADDLKEVGLYFLIAIVGSALILSVFLFLQRIEDSVGGFVINSPEIVIAAIGSGAALCLGIGLWRAKSDRKEAQEFWERTLGPDGLVAIQQKHLKLMARLVPEELRDEADAILRMAQEDTVHSVCNVPKPEDGLADAPWRTKSPSEYRYDET